MARKRRCIKGQTVMVPPELRAKIDKLATEREVSIGDICREATEAGQRRLVGTGRWPVDPPRGTLTEQVSWMDTVEMHDWIMRRKLDTGMCVSWVRRALLLEGLR